MCSHVPAPRGPSRAYNPPPHPLRKYSRGLLEHIAFQKTLTAVQIARMQAHCYPLLCDVS